MESQTHKTILTYKLMRDRETGLKCVFFKIHYIVHDTTL